MASVTPIRDEQGSPTAVGQDTPPAPPARRRRAPLIVLGLVAVAGGIAAFLYGSRLGQAKADVAAAESRKQLTQVDRERAERLRRLGAATQAEIDARLAADQEADAALAQSRARLASALANRSNSTGTEASARGRLLAAQ